ncbi:replication initiation protein [Aneurinibacillus migulanus]|uniref:Initiator Replication protein n=1 Tax=Aneurinibacillus migulanus TaxID=47500 RepID=A0A1G8WL42_ANEMI|nr:replication initiation protein [Aneurinibacillus migulanus]MED0894856.1 replication initiation protein [Aneurinibacillus migulanus]MED1614393.1 replication initiation protein [Aneurinibacillus migulanus]GED14804.1 hypothetical protein AMI01nite_27950 [Aneurinibacillus migulanus]SDJ79098.1 Initiator Replication protein [Aneurinibacillus migulanus]
MNALEKIDEKLIVTKSNDLIEASYRLTLHEQRIICILAAKIQPEDTVFRTCRIEVGEFIDLLGLKGKSIHNDIKKIIKDFVYKGFEIKSEGVYTVSSWFEWAKYKEKEGFMEFKFSEELIPFLLQLKERFTSYRLNNVIPLRSSYSIRIYELLKQYANIGERTFDLEHLKSILGIEPDEYKLYGHFKSRVLTSAQKELDEKTDLSFEFEELKASRKVVGVRFIITRGRSTKEINHIEPKIVEEIAIASRLKAFGLTQAQIEYILKTYDESYILENLHIVEKDYLAGRVKNITGYAYKALEQDYRKNKPEIEKQLEGQKSNPAYEGIPEHILRQMERQKALEAQSGSGKEPSREEQRKRVKQMLLAFGEK